MSRHLGHLDPEALARIHRSGRVAAHVMRCARCAKVCEQLEAVRTALASAPVPTLPEHAEQRILSAIAAEVITRQSVPRQSSGQDPVSGDHRVPRERSPGKPARGQRGSGRFALRVAGSRRNRARQMHHERYVDPSYPCWQAYCLRASAMFSAVREFHQRRRRSCRSWARPRRR